MSPQDAFHETVHAALGGCEALAVRLNMSPAVLRNKANPNTIANRVTLEDADRVMGLTGNCAVLDALAANHGRVCIKVDDAATASDIAVLELVTQVWSANGEVGAEVHRTLADGVVEPHEVDRVRAAVYRTQKALLEVVARLDGMIETKPRPRK